MSLADTATGIFNAVTIELYGTNGGLTGPGTVEITGDETNYATCRNCVRGSRDCDASLCATEFMARAGTLTITAIEQPSISGSLTGVELVEVTIDPQTFVSTPVPGGESWCIDSLSFP